MENTDGVCALCHYNWFEENDLTLLCSNNDCKPLECHVFCLDYLDRSGIKISNTGGPNGSKHHEKTTNNLNLPEEDRDWYCPACHPYGTLISLLQYFEWSKNISRKRDAQDEFQNFIMTDPVRLIGRVIRLHIPFPVTATHLGNIIPSLRFLIPVGRIVDQRITHDQVEYFIQFRR